jgi:hypothetical protein
MKNMSIFKKIMKAISGGDKEQPHRALKSVNDLKANDMITLSDSYALPESLRGKQLEVQSVSTYDYDGEKEVEWVLKGSDDGLIHLSLDEDDDTFLAFSIPIKRSEVEVLFDLDDFAKIFENKGGFSIKKAGDVPRLANWCSDEYNREGFSENGIFHKKDHRHLNGERLGSGEGFDLYTLVDGDEDKGISIEVWKDGSTDVSVVIYRPLTDIVDFFAGS